MNKWKDSPHFVRHVRLMRQIHEEKLWDAPEDVADPVYEESYFHWEFLTDEEKEADATFSRLLHIALRDEVKDPEWNGEDFVSYCRMMWEETLLREQDAEEALDDLHDRMDGPWYRLNEEEMRLVRLFGSLLNLTLKKKEIVS